MAAPEQIQMTVVIAQHAHVAGGQSGEPHT